MKQPALYLIKYELGKKHSASAGYEFDLNIHRLNIEKENLVQKQTDAAWSMIKTFWTKPSNARIFWIRLFSLKTASNKFLSYIKFHFAPWSNIFFILVSFLSFFSYICSFLLVKIPRFFFLSFFFYFFSFLLFFIFAWI